MSQVMQQCRRLLPNGKNLKIRDDKKFSHMLLSFNSDAFLVATSSLDGRVATHQYDPGMHDQ